EDEDFLRRGTRFEHGLGFADCRGDVCAAARDHFRIKGVERFAESVIIERHRALQKGVASEGHEAHAVAVQLVQEIMHGEFCAGKPVRLHVLGEHALRSINGEKQLESLSMCFLPLVASLRSSERDEEAEYAE